MCHTVKQKGTPICHLIFSPHLVDCFCCIWNPELRSRDRNSRLILGCMKHQDKVETFLSTFLKPTLRYIGCPYAALSIIPWLNKSLLAPWWDFSTEQTGQRLLLGKSQYLKNRREYLNNRKKRSIYKYITGDRASQLWHVPCQWYAEDFRMAWRYLMNIWMPLLALKNMAQDGDRNCWTAASAIPAFRWNLSTLEGSRAPWALPGTKEYIPLVQKFMIFLQGSPPAFVPQL